MAIFWFFFFSLCSYCQVCISISVLAKYKICLWIWCYNNNPSRYIYYILLRYMYVLSFNSLNKSKKKNFHMFLLIVTGTHCKYCNRPITKDLNYEQMYCNIGKISKHQHNQMHTLTHINIIPYRYTIFASLERTDMFHDIIPEFNSVHTHYTAKQTYKHLFKFAFNSFLRTQSFWNLILFSKTETNTKKKNGAK